MTTTDRPRPELQDRPGTPPAGDGPQAPIYDSLIDEHGDVLSEVRKVAEELQQEADRALDFSIAR
ncbi:hypothetical protein [Streptomyces sp. JJ36]|uniref:hypothetical protein n=1 Tax=Streptomyces sp. JJ36 TaxID=2736645 RepID=UPI001F38048B|nr:hypothetical protein [Streptomyces sp. JJ36]MCF6524846.1 hypothetical protein [Streptomyces sp. JJ36]